MTLFPLSYSFNTSLGNLSKLRKLNLLGMRKPKPILCSSVIGHVYMRSFVTVAHCYSNVASAGANRDANTTTQ